MINRTFYVRLEGQSVGVKEHFLVGDGNGYYRLKEDIEKGLLYERDDIINALVEDYGFLFTESPTWPGAAISMVINIDQRKVFHP